MRAIKLFIILAWSYLFAALEASMESGDFGPKSAQIYVEREGGSYSTWSTDELPILSQDKVGATKLVLEPLGLTLPYYAYSSKICLVTQGKGRLGIIFPKSSEQKVVEIEEGDVIPAPFPALSWLFNDGDSTLTMICLADTSKAYSPGYITGSTLAGANGIFTGFSNDFVSKAWGLDEVETNTLLKSQSGTLIVKLEEGNNLPQSSEADKKEMICNIKAALPDINVKNGGQLVVLSDEKFPLLGEVGLSGMYVWLDANAMFSPEFSSDSAVQVIYVVRGSGRVQVVDINSKRVLDTTVKDGDLFVLPRFFVIMTVAGDEGMEWFSMVTTTKPFINFLVGKTSLWNALTPQVVQVSFNLTLEEAEAFFSKISKNPVFIPASMLLTS